MALIFKIAEGLCRDFNAHIFAVLVVLVVVQLWIYHKSSIRATGCSGRMDMIEHDIKSNVNRIDITDQKVNDLDEKVDGIDKVVFVLREKFKRVSNVES